MLLLKRGFNSTNLTRRQKREKEKAKVRKRIFKILACLTFIIGILYINPNIIVNVKHNIENNTATAGIYKGKVMGVKREEYTYLENTYEKKKGVQNIEVMVTNGNLKGKVLGIQNNYDYSNPYSYVIKGGDRVFLSIHETSGGNIEKAYIHDFDRSGYLIILVLIFFFALFLFGGRNGVKTFISLILILPIILKIIPYYLLKGYNHILVIFISSLFLICIISLILWGFNRESVSTMIGSLGGMILGGALVFIFQYLCKLTGIPNGEVQMIMYGGKEINFIGIIFGGIIIGSLGAMMNISLNITKAMRNAEMETLNIKFGELLKVGFKEGKSSIGSISNTLILAYLGAALQTIIVLMVSNNMSILQGVNGEALVVEILRVVSGILGFIFAIPVTAFTYALFSKNAALK
ncbi:YibE/F family protein [Hathewaya histolytica]|uniref:YibE/F family protein n=1 Tax=Hathewaya histolytica TaxID=1498 RepID=UPI003B67B99B